LPLLYFQATGAYYILCLRWLSRKKFPGGSEAGNWWLPRGIIFRLACGKE
jgi:hypothetical protein